MWTAARVPNLVPLRKLQNLRSLQLAGVRVADGSLLPLTSLTNLRFLTLSNWFRTEEFAELAVAFPEIEGGSFESMWWVPPHPAKPGEFDLCKRCKAFKPGLSIGKPMRQLCPRCDEAAIAKFSTRWAALVQAAKDRPKVRRSRATIR